jgi:hypothetical protein
MGLNARGLMGLESQPFEHAKVIVI